MTHFAGKTQIETQLAYILHSRAYRETSLLLEIFTRDYGRISAVAKGVRGARSKARGLLQPFVPLLISCVGKSELLTLKCFEAAGPVPRLKGRQWVSGFYLNELLIRLLHKEDPNKDIFDSYEATLKALENPSTEQYALRLFEKSLLKGLGYALPLTKEAETGAPILEEEQYSFDPERGPYKVEKYIECVEKPLYPNSNFFMGKSLLALHHEMLNEPALLNDAKRLLRQALAIYLGPKPLESRKLLKYPVKPFKPFTLGAGVTVEKENP